MPNDTQSTSRADCGKEQKQKLKLDEQRRRERLELDGCDG